MEYVILQAQRYSFEEGSIFEIHTHRMSKRKGEKRQCAACTGKKRRRTATFLSPPLFNRFEVCQFRSFMNRLCRLVRYVSTLVHKTEPGNRRFKFGAH